MGAGWRPSVPPMLTHVATFAIYGLEPRRVWVEVDIRAGLPTFTVVGLADKAVREARERVRAALLNSGFEFPGRRITANLAPAYLRKAGPGYDLALAVGILAASGQLDPEPLDPLRGLRRAGPRRRAACVPRCAGRRGGRAGAAGPSGPPRAARQAAEAALVEGVAIAGVETLREAVEVLGGEREPPPPPPGAEAAADDSRAAAADLADVRGHAIPRWALEIAAAGGHNLLMQGPPGTGKTMLARRLPGDPAAAQRPGGDRGHADPEHRRPAPRRRARRRAPLPRAAPHDLVGRPRRRRSAARCPGEATLAHLGVLFLDELSEFPRPSLEALRQPLEDGYVTVVRSQHVSRLPDPGDARRLHQPVPVRLRGRRRRALPLQRGRARPPSPPSERAAARSHRPARRRPAPHRLGARRAGVGELDDGARAGRRSA